MKQDAFSAGVEPGGLWHKNDIRILLCYILASVGAPLSRQDLSRIIQEKGLANYFEVEAPPAGRPECCPLSTR